MKFDNFVIAHFQLVSRPTNRAPIVCFGMMLQPTGMSEMFGRTGPPISGGRRLVSCKIPDLKFELS